MLYCDTDSFLYYVESAVPGLTYDFIMTHLFPKNYLDRSNFDTLDKMEGTYQPGALGLLKSELGDDIAEEVVIINPKAYSIQTRKRGQQQQQQQRCSVTATQLARVKDEAAERVRLLALEREEQVHQQQHQQQQTLPLPQREWWLPLTTPTPQSLAEGIRKNCQEERENAKRLQSELEDMAAAAHLADRQRQQQQQCRYTYQM